MATVQKISGQHAHTLSGVGALWDCLPRVYGGGRGCAGGGVPLEAVPALSWCGEVSLGGIRIIIQQTDKHRHPQAHIHRHTHRGTHTGGRQISSPS